MIQEDKIKILILEEMTRAQAKNPRYSMRSFSKKIGIAQSALSEILSGKRPLSQKTALKILSSFGMPPHEVNELMYENKKRENFNSIDLDNYKMISDWYYFAILSLSETDDFVGKADWISNRLGITLTKTVDALERLARLDMLEIDPKTGLYKSTGEQFAAISSVANAALKKANRQNLELAQEVLEQTVHEERDYSAITICFDPDRMNEAREMIKKFRREFSNVMESGKKKEVYKLCLQLFPLTKGEQK